MGLDVTSLNEIMEDNPDSTEKCFTDMLSKWLKMVEPPPSWEKLLVALKHPSVGHAELVDEVTKKLGIALESSVDGANCHTKTCKILATHI